MQQTITQLRFKTARLSTGVQLHYAEQGDPDGEAIICLHGYSDSWFSFSRLLPLLPARYHVFAPDQRGHGDSERPADGYSMDNYAADVVAFLDAVGIARATIVGHSMGTFVARLVAEAHPDRVSRLVLIDSSGTAVNAVMSELHEYVKTLDDPVPTEFVREFQESTAHVPLPESFMERVISESLKLPARVWRDALDGLMAVDDAGQIGRIAVPTLLLWGDRDGLFSRADQEYLVAAIPGARLTIYPETGHTPQWERPEQVAADFDAFVRG